MKVQAAPGLLCPKEGQPREYISDSDPLEVPETSYYLRLVDDGSLVIAPPPGKASKNEAPKGGDAQ